MSSIASLSLLFVDSDEDLNFLHKSLFELAGCCVEVASTLAEALAILKGYKPDVVFADLRLEDFSGMELAGHLRASSSIKNMSLVALTSCFRPGIAQEARSAGFDGYLLKPASHEAILEVLKRCQHAASSPCGTRTMPSMPCEQVAVALVEL